LTFTRLHGIISQKIELFITTTVRTSKTYILMGLFSLCVDYSFFFTVRRLLIKGVSPDSTNEDGLTALHQVCAKFILQWEISENPKFVDS
jgi:hypothetical protein